MKKIFSLLFVLISFASYGQLYQSMPQPGYYINRVWVPGLLTIPNNNTAVSNISGGKDTGKIIYNIPDSSIGIYTGSQWLYFHAGASSIGWGLTGNSATDPSTDFLGTTDAKSLNFRVNNLPSGYIGYGPGSTYNTFFGYQAGKNTATTLNTGFGYKALMTQTSGNSNTAFGFQSLLNNTSGSANVGVGHDVLGTNSSGNYGTAIGLDALFNNTTGDGNTAVGYSAGLSNSTGNYNTAFGFTSGWGTTGSNNISIGAYAGLYNSTFSDRLYISSYDFATHANDSLKAIIYGIQDGTTTANQKLFLNAELYAPYISSATSANTLYYNTSTKKVTYGVASSGTQTLQQVFNQESGVAVMTGSNTIAIGNNNFNQTIGTGTVTLSSGGTTQTSYQYSGNSLTTGIGYQFQSSSLTTGKLVDVQVSGTGADNGLAGFNVDLIGVNAGSNKTTNALRLSNAKTGTGAVSNALLIAAGTINIQPLTASRPLKLDASKNVISTTIDLSSSSDVANRLPFANFTQGSALSVLGITGNSTADFASIAAGTDNQVLRRSGTSLAFGAINIASSNAVTGLLAIANGGLNNNATPTNGYLLIGDGTKYVPTDPISTPFIISAGLAGGTNSGQTGDGFTTIFNIPHGLSGTPAWFMVQAASSGASNSNIKYIEADATNIIIHYYTSPISGADLSWVWVARL